MSVSAWNFTIDDSSSFITYAPHGDGGLGNWTRTGWQPWYSGSGGFCSGEGDQALGESRHITSFPGASLQFQFYGNAVYLYGTSNCSFDISIDNSSIPDLQAPATVEDLLYSIEGLSDDMHYFNLTAHPDPNSGQLIAFDSAVVTIPIDAGTGAPIPVAYENTNSSVFQYTGQWVIDAAPDVPSPTSTAPYHLTSAYGSSVSMHFIGEAVAVYGFRDWGNWLYSVSLDGSVAQYNGSTMWEIGNALLFFQAGLNPNQTHTLNITAGGQNFMLNAVTAFVPNTTKPNTSVTTSTGLGIGPSTSATLSSIGPSASATGDSTSKKTSTGVIVGSVIGAVGGLAALLALLWWLLRKCSLREPDIDPFPPMSSMPDSGTLQSTSQGSFVSSKAPAVGAGEPSAVRQASAGPGSVTPIRVDVHHPAPSPRQVNAVSAAGSSYVGPVAASSSASQTQSPQAPSASQPMDVDRIIELIATRIDGWAVSSPHDPDAPPPQYPSY